MNPCKTHKLKFRTRVQAWKVAIELSKKYSKNYQPFKCFNGTKRNHWHLTSRQKVVNVPKRLTLPPPKIMRIKCEGCNKYRETEQHYDYIVRNDEIWDYDFAQLCVECSQKPFPNTWKLSDAYRIKGRRFISVKK